MQETKSHRENHMEQTFDLRGMKIAICIPCYSGKVPIEWVISYAETQQSFSAHGVRSYMQVRMNSGLIHAVRNELVHTALQSEDTTHILFIDDDIVWDANDALRLLAWTQKHDFVCGVYPARTDDPTFFVDLANVNGEFVQSPDGLLRANGVPAGFMLIKREVFENPSLKAQCPVTKPTRGDLKGELVHGYFDYLHEGLTGNGEDISFCKRWARAGGEIWVDPSISLKHIGSKAYNHEYIPWLKARQNANDSNSNDRHSDPDRIESGGGSPGTGSTSS